MRDSDENFTDETISAHFIPPLAKTWNDTLNISERDVVNRFNHLLDINEVLLKSLTVLLYSRLRHYDAALPFAEFLQSKLPKPYLGTFLTFIDKCRKTLSPQGDPWTAELNQGLRTKLAHASVMNLCRQVKDLEGQAWGKPEIAVNALCSLLVEFRNRTRGHGTIREEHCEQVNHDLRVTLFEMFRALQPALTGGWYAVQAVRHRAVHGRQTHEYEMYELQGVSRKLVAETTDADLLDGRLYAADPRVTPAWLELWPLAHWERMKKEVYLYNNFLSDRKVEFLCYTSGDHVHLENVSFAELFNLPPEAPESEPPPDQNIAVRLLKDQNAADHTAAPICVSYVCADDRPGPEMAAGAVTALLTRLKTLLGQKLAPAYGAALWLDEPLQGNGHITAEILDAVRQTPILLVILSRAYLASDWCQREPNPFLQMVQERMQADASVFVIECDRLADAERLAAFAEVTGYRYPFWDQPRYHHLLTDLSYDLADKLQKLRRLQQRAREIPQARAPMSAARPTVFLADVTDDLYTEWEHVKESLTQANLQVLPAEPYYLPEMQALQQAVRADLAQSALFVQLLSAVTGKRPKDLRQSRARCQYELALAANKPVLQWRAPQLDVAAVPDPDQRALLQLDTVLALELEQFIAQIVDRLRPPPAAPARPADFNNLGILLFLNANIDKDSALFEQIQQVFEQSGVSYVTPLQSQSPTENRAAFEQYVLECDALVIVYGEVSVKWVTDQCLAIRKIFCNRTQPLTFAIFDGPPEEKPPVNIKFPNMRILYCRNCVNEQKLVDFIESLRKERSAHE